MFADGDTLTIGFKGDIKANGVPAQLEGGNRHLDTVGGIIDVSNTQKAYYGRIVSVDPDDPDNFILGWETGLVVKGPLVNNQFTRENMPAAPDYIINGQPAVAALKGGLMYASWGKDASGAIDPAEGCIICFKRTTGEINFLPDGHAIPAGYKPLLAAVTKVDVFNDIVIINFEPQSYPIIPTEDIT